MIECKYDYYSITGLGALLVLPNHLAILLSLVQLSKNFAVLRILLLTISKFRHFGHFERDENILLHPKRKTNRCLHHNLDTVMYGVIIIHYLKKTLK